MKSFTALCALVLVLVVLMMSPSSDATIYKIKAGQPFQTGQRTSVSQGPGGNRVVETDSYTNEGPSNNNNNRQMPSLFPNGRLLPLNLNMRL